MVKPDVAVFENLYATYRPAVWRYARRRTPTVLSADDIVAETFVVAWRRWEHVPLDRPLPWLYGVSKNILRAAYRQTSRQQELQERLQDAGYGDEGARDPLSQLLTKEKLGHVTTVIKGMPPHAQMVFRAAVYGEMSHHDIAQQLGCSVSTVAVRLHRARHALAKALRTAL